MDHRSGAKVAGTFRARPELLCNVGLISNFLRQLVKDLGMTTLGTHIYDVPIAIKRMGLPCECDEGGITGVTVLSTSHAAIHTWPEEGAARFDVDSCRTFEPRIVEELIKMMFETVDVEIFDLSFCLKPSLVNQYNQNPEAAQYVQEMMDWIDESNDQNFLV